MSRIDVPQRRNTKLLTAAACAAAEDFRIDPFDGWMLCTLTNKKIKIASGSGFEVNLIYGL